jgi:hypothetical protein
VEFVLASIDSQPSDEFVVFCFGSVSDCPLVELVLPAALSSTLVCARIREICVLLELTVSSMLVVGHGTAFSVRSGTFAVALEFPSFATLLFASLIESMAVDSECELLLAFGSKLTVNNLALSSLSVQTR